MPYANFITAGLSNADFHGAWLDWTDLKWAHFDNADLRRANLNDADLEGANLKGVKELTIDQLSQVKTLYNTKLDDELLKPLKEKYPALFEEPKK